MIGNNRQVELTQPGRYTALGYRSATIAAREGRHATSASGSAHIEYSRLKLIAQSRQFMRDNPIYKGMIERAVSYIVGNGFALQAKTSDPKANVLIEKWWKKIWKRPEIRNILSGRECERMVCRELLSIGDGGILKTRPQKIQIIEAEQICGKSGNGLKTIDTNGFGTPKGYWVGGYATSGNIDRRTIKKHSPEVFLFIGSPDRPSSIRSVPPCQAAFSMLHRVNDVCDSEAIAWQILARMAISITQKEGKEIGFKTSNPKEAKTDDPELKTRVTELGYALIFHGEEGTEIKGIDRNIPGKNFPESLRMFLRLLGLPLGLPLEIILLDWTKSNYSQSRAVLEQAFVTFLNVQFKLADFMMTPVYEWLLRGAIANGDLKINEKEDTLNHDWIKPTFPWIDQLKEALAWGEKLDRGLTIHARALKSLGFDRSDEMDERQKEIEDAIERAKKIEEKTGMVVPWQHFAGLKPTKDDLLLMAELSDGSIQNNKGNNND